MSAVESFSLDNPQPDPDFACAWNVRDMIDEDVYVLAAETAAVFCDPVSPSLDVHFCAIRDDSGINGNGPSGGGSCAGRRSELRIQAFLVTGVEGGRESHPLVLCLWLGRRCGFRFWCLTGDFRAAAAECEVLIDFDGLCRFRVYFPDLAQANGLDGWCQFDLDVLSRYGLGSRKGQDRLVAQDHQGQDDRMHDL